MLKACEAFTMRKVMVMIVMLMGAEDAFEYDSGGHYVISKDDYAE